MPVNVITRSNAEALIPTQIANEIISGVTDTANVLQLMRRLPNMTAKQYKLPVLAPYLQGLLMKTAPWLDVEPAKEARNLVITLLDGHYRSKFEALKLFKSHGVVNYGNVMKAKRHNK